MPRTIHRPLTLHVSALSDAEYNTYTNSLSEITSPLPDVDWEAITMGVREARGWIRGRYRVDGAVVDEVLRLFCPELGAHDILTGGQFFAVLRLICHAQTGAAVDESLVFVQANLDPAAVPRSPSPPKVPPLSRTPSSKSAPPPPPRPSNSSPDTTPSLPPRTAPPVPSPNPFHRSTSHPASPLPRIANKIDPPVSSNPFLRSQPQPQPAPSLSSTSSTSSNPRQYASPPLPPRRTSTSLLPPPRHGSLPPKPAFAPPIPAPLLKPPKPPQATSPLIKQSLQAAKGAQSVKEVQEGLSRQRRWEVIKKSGSTSTGAGETNGSSSSGSGSVGGTPRPVSPPASFYDVAAARIVPSPAASASSAASADVTPAQDRTPPSPSSPGLNPRRSKSLHHPSPASASAASFPVHTPPAPPPRRKRPESVQVTSTSASASGSPFANGTFANGHTSMHTRSASGSGSGAGSRAAQEGSVLETLHRTFTHLRPGPGFESARVRAEGRVWPGGYVRGLGGDGARLVREGGGEVDDGFGQDAAGADGDVERDELKMPVRPGEGWTALG